MGHDVAPARPTTRSVRALGVVGLTVFAAATLLGCGRGGSPDAKPLAVFGQTGLGPGDFSYPRTIAVAPDDRMFVIDKAARVQRFDPDGKYEFGWRMPEWRLGKPTGVAVHPDGRLYIADTHYSRVVIYDRDGRLLDQFGSNGDGPGQFRLPTNVAFDRDGFIYVSEYGGNDRISKFTPDHEFVMSFGGPDAGDASFQRPQCMDFDASQTLWVADACNHRISHFTRDGQWLGAFGHVGSAPGELRYPYGVRVAPDGNLLVTEYGNSRVQKLTPQGRSLWTLGRPGREPGQFAAPWSLVIGDRGRRLYVVDSGNNRIQVFAL